MPINQVYRRSPTAMHGGAGGRGARLPGLWSQPPEVDDGHRDASPTQSGRRTAASPCGERTGLWAWKDTHKDTGDTEPLRA